MTICMIHAVCVPETATLTAGKALDTAAAQILSWQPGLPSITGKNPVSAEAGEAEPSFFRAAPCAADFVRITPSARNISEES